MLWLFSKPHILITFENSILNVRILLDKLEREITERERVGGEEETKEGGRVSEKERKSQSAVETSMILFGPNLSNHPSILKSCQICYLFQWHNIHCMFCI